MRQTLIYVMLSVLCTAAMLRFYLNIRRYEERTQQAMYLRHAFICGICFTIMNPLFALFEGGVLPDNTPIRYISEIWYTVCCVLCAYFWCLATQREYDSVIFKSRLLRVLYMLPAALIILCTLTTPLNHLQFFYERGKYHRGVLNTPFVLIITAMVLICGIEAFIASFRKENYLRRAHLRHLCAFALFHLLVQVLQIIFGPELPFRALGATIVFYIVQENIIKKHIFMDVMSGISNRNAFEHYMRGHFRNPKDSLCLVMIDLDNFKRVNDVYGHAAGDRAIRLMAEALKRSAGPMWFISRYGGDEFAVIGNHCTDEDIEILKLLLRRNLDELTGREALPFAVNYSCGAAYLTPDIKTVPDFIAAADKLLYRNKRG